MDNNIYGHNCNDTYFEENEDISREIQGIGIKNPQGSDFVANCRDAPIISDRDVCFPASPKEILIITYKDRCLLCGKYLGEPYNMVYVFKEGILGLKGNKQTKELEILTKRGK